MSVEEQPAFNFIWWKALLSVFCLCLSAIFSGLTLGLMGQDTTQLIVISESGPPDERKNAKKILPLRRSGNLLLCTLLLGNVAVNVCLPIFMAEMAGGLIGLLVSTFFIVIFGEIIPQATCSKYALTIGAALLPVVKLFMVVLYPIAKPISLCLDFVLGSDMGQIYDKNELGQLLDAHAERAGESGIDDGQAKLMKAALDFTVACASDIMTKIEDAYMLELDTKLEEDIMTSIWQTGHSRIPVFEKTVNNIVGMFFTKDLILVNPRDGMTIRTLLAFYHRTVHMIFGDTTLPDLLKYFKTGKAHLAIVRHVNSAGPGDPFYENIGLVTLEDVIEQLIKDEIVDETDVYRDNETKQLVGRSNLHDWNLQSQRSIRLTPEQASACAWYLHNSVEGFGQSIFDIKTVSRLVAESIVKDWKVKSSDVHDLRPPEKLPLHIPGEPLDSFVLVISGKIEVTSGRDGFVCELGSWNHLGLQALLSTDYVPDFSAVVASDSRLLHITRRNYNKAKALYSASAHPSHHDASVPLYTNSSQ